MLTSLVTGLVGFAALNGARAQDTEDVITDDTVFYGQSEPVYPSPNMSSTGPWARAYANARAMVSQMTIEEKVNLTAGAPADNGCSGNIPSVERLGFPGLCLSDAGNGLRGTDFVNSWPSGIHVGASWNRELARKRAEGMGGEFRKKGVNVMLGPMVGPLGRVVAGGRNWEAFSVDPYLSGQLVYETVAGVQDQGVITSTKHFVGNEQEEHRNPVGEIFSISTNMDDKTMHEFYMWPFADAVHAGTGNIMCSYQRLNNSYGCQNSKALNGMLKTELGFQGFVVSDWFAQHGGVASALGGLDMAMPDGGVFWGPLLVDAVNNGSVPESRLDDMAMRIVAPWYKMGQDQDFPVPGAGMPVNLNEPHTIVDGRAKSSRKILFDGAVEGHVLVKNEGILPLKEPRMLGLYGYDAPAWPAMTSSGSTDGWTLGALPVSIEEVWGAFMNANVTKSSIGINGTMIFGGGSGAGAPSYLSSPAEAISSRCAEDGTAMFWDYESVDPYVDAASDVCIVVGNVWATEAYDRPELADEYTDTLITNVASKCANTVVVFHNAGTRLVDSFANHPNVTAIIFAHLPGQDSGKALASILYGDSNPSGKLPYTVARAEEDYGNTTYPDLAEGKYALFPQSNFDEGVFLDYRRFDAEDIEPRYAFGFGLSYTTFEYSDLKVRRSRRANTQEYPTGAIEEGGQADLWEVVATVSARVKNTGSVDGMEVAQLYIGIPGESEPVKVLRGFEKPMISARGRVKVEFELTRRDLSVWDVEAQMWKLQAGEYTVMVGGSSRDLPLAGTLEI